jgi:hypothetical protein
MSLGLLINFIFQYSPTKVRNLNKTVRKVLYIKPTRIHLKILKIVNNQVIRADIKTNHSILAQKIKGINNI